MNAQASPNFSSILDEAPSEVDRPKPLPVGTYTTIIQGLPRFDKSTKKQTEYVEFTHKILAAGDDVDQEELASMGGIKDKTMKNTYYLTEASKWRLDEFLTHCGINLDGESSRREMVEQTPGKQVGIYVTHEASQDGTAVYAKIGKTVIVE